MDIAELLAFSVKNKASDLHLSSGLPPMIRVDGDVRRINIPALDHKQVQALVYDIMSDKQRRDFEEFLEVDFSFEIPGLARFRVNAFKQNRGSAAVFRTIPSQILTLDELGCPKIFRELIEQPQGLILVTGPTGSGKSTTLAAMVDHVNKNEFGHILTIEDPIEFVHASQKCLINQREVHRDTHGFEAALRSALREDPDYILVGEMRDPETASIGVNAALTGHLVLTTLHTNSAAGAVVRLLDLGVQAYLIASTLRCIIAQRLVRKLCIHCREPYEATPDLLAQLPDSAGASGHASVTLYKACGCTYCGNTGFSGRAAIFEVMVIDDHVRRLIKPGVSADVIAHAARKAGTASMMADGFAKCREGLTTIEELGRVTSED